MHHLLFAFYLFLLAAVFARVEIEIEGPNGWAASLPTWRLDNKWTRLLCGSRPLTGYHLWLQVFVFLFVHCPIALGFVAWSWPVELKLVGFGILFFIVEDFLWFVLNPAYGLRRFKRENIWWHARNWWWFMPRDYWIFLSLGAGIYVLGTHLQ